MTNSNKKNSGGKIIIKIFSLVFKIVLSVTSILFIALFSFLIILSVKPRVIPVVNNYILNKINSLPETKLSFDSSNATLYLESPTKLIYTVNNLVLESYDTELKLSKFILDLDFIELLYKKITINTIILKGSSLNIEIQTEKEKNKTENFDYKKIIVDIQNYISKALSNKFLIKNFSLRDFNINFLSNNKNINVYIKNSSFDINIQENNLIINQNTVFNVNSSKLDSRLITVCENEKKNKKCSININGVNLNDYTDFFNTNSTLYDYTKNIKGLFDININFILNEDLEFENGNATISSKIGSFDLRQFFDQKIIFVDLIAEADFKDNFKQININSVKTYFGKTDFMMSMSITEEDDYRNVDLNFDIKNIQLKNLKQLWPNFLGQEEGIRPWVIEHIPNGISPRAWAKINMKYFKNEDDKHSSGLQEIYSEVQIQKAELNYSDYFPIITNIDGLAIFTKNNMDIKITNGNVLSTKINDGRLFMDFTKNIKSLLISAHVNGLFSDLFVHIDKSEQELIETKVSDIVEDYYAITKLDISVPIVDDIDFYKTSLSIKTNIVNKPNYILKNSSNIPITFTKPKNSEKFFGSINLTNSNIEFLPLNLYKPAKKDLKFDYESVLKDSIVYITKFDPTVDYIKFNIDGILDIDKKEQEVSAENIKYNGSNYNLYYKSFVKNNKVYNNINIVGNNINYSNIIERIKDPTPEVKNTNKSNKNKIETETNITLVLKYFSFLDNKKLINPSMSLKIKDEKVDCLNFYADMENKKFVKLKFDKKNKMFNFNSNDFGRLFDTTGLTDRVKDGSGEININQKNIDGKDVLVGNLNITKKFSIVPDDYVKKEVLSDVKQDKNFKKLEKGLKKDTGITIDKLRGDFTYNNDILVLKEIVANSRFISLQILISGFANMKTGEIEMNGLLVPLGFINGLFGINKLPVIGELIFGQKDAGLFASRFTVRKKNNDSKMDININKFSMVLPGFLRNIFTRSEPIKTN